MSLSLEEQNEALEQMINTFTGYQDPFWYEKKKSKYDELYWKAIEVDARIKLEIEKKRPNTKSVGTRPDKEVRWKNYPKCAGTNHMVEYIESLQRLDNHLDLLKERVEFTTSLPKMDDRGAIVGVKKEK